MSCRRRIHLLSLLLLPAVLGAKELPTTAELRTMLDAKQYKAVMREVARAMSVKGNDGAIAYDRGELLLIRGEAQLGLRAEPGAAKSFREAVEAAENESTRRSAQTLGLLLDRAEGLTYTAKTGPAAARREIDIVADRNAALAALLTDETAAAESRVASTKSADRIAEVLEVAKSLEPLAALEETVGGATNRTGEFRTELASRVDGLLDKALGDMDRRADKVEETARSLIAIPQEVPPGQPAPPARLKRRGVTRNDEAALREIMDGCREIVSRSRDVALQLGAEHDRFHDANNRAIRVSAKAGSIMRADYSGVVEEPSAPSTQPAQQGKS